MQKIVHCVIRFVGALALAAGVLSAWAEPKGPEYAVVTSASDGTGGGGEITLRDAVGAMSDPAFTNAAGARVITFKSGLTVRLNEPLVIGEGTAPFVIDGGTDDAEVGISSAKDCRLIELNGLGLDLRNLTLGGGFAGEGAGGAILATGPASVTNQTLVVSNCAFVANRAADGAAIAADSNTSMRLMSCTFRENTATGGAGAVRTAGRMTAVNCTFYSNASSGGASALAVHSGGDLLVAKCTVCGGLGPGGGIHVAAGAAATVCDSLVTYNMISDKQEGESAISDLVNAGTLSLYGSGFTSKVAGVAPVVNRGCQFDLLDKPFYAEEYERQTPVNGVTNTVFVPVYCEAVTNGAGRLLHDADWTNVAVQALSPGGTVTALRGDSGLATLPLTVDQTGREERPARGALRHGYVNRITFVDGGSTVGSAERPCGSDDVPNAPTVWRIGFSLKGWNSRADGNGLWLWDATGQPKRENLPRIPYEPLVAYAIMEMSDAAFTVASGGDEPASAGLVTLRALMETMAAHPEWKGTSGRRVITIPASVGQVTLTNTLTVADGTVPFAICGAATGGTNVTIRMADGANRLFSVENAAMAFENLTLEGGDGELAYVNGPGGAIRATRADGLLAVTNCAFRAFRARGAGGAVWLAGAGAFGRCTFFRNQVFGGHYLGGAVCVEGLSRTTFADCSFIANGAGTDGEGGAVNCESASTFLRCTFFGNSAAVAGAVSARGGTCAFADCLAVSNTPVSVIADLGTDVLAADATVYNQTVGGAHHVYVRPRHCPAIIEPASADTLQPDLLGLSSPVRGLGAIRGELGIRVDLNPGQGGSVSGDSFVWAVCGRTFVGLTASRAVRDRSKFMGWWTGEGRTGVRCFDGDGMGIGGGVPFREAMILYAGWAADFGSLEVTTGADTTGKPSSLSLRDAIGQIVSRADEVIGDDPVTVTFSLPRGEPVLLDSPIQIPPKAPNILLDGFNHGDGVTIRTSGSGAAPASLFEANGRAFCLANLTLEGDAATAVVSTNGYLAASNCVFSVSGRALSATGSGVMLFNSTVAAPLTCRAGVNTAVNCTFLGGVADSLLDCADGALVVKSTFAGGAAPSGATLCDVLADASALAGGEWTNLTGAVAHRWAPALFGDAATNDAATVLHDEDWANVRTARPSGEARTLRGVAERATLPLASDQFGQGELLPARGAVRSRFAVRYDLDPAGGTLGTVRAWSVCGEVPRPLPVPVRDGFAFAGWCSKEDGTQLFDAKGCPRDGVLAPWRESLPLVARWSVRPEILTVRDAASLANALAALADPNNEFPDRTVRFEADIELAERLRISESTAPFTIDGCGKSLSGGGRSAGLLLHEGKGLTLCNLTLKNSGGAQGALCSRGPLAAENCAFSDNVSQGVASAVVVGGGTGVFVNCSFSGNAVDERQTQSGGALVVEQGGTCVLVHCTFCGNSAKGAGVGASATLGSSNGRLSAIGCSFAEADTAVCVSGGTAQFAGSAFANTKGVADLVVATGATVSAERCTFSNVTLASGWTDCMRVGPQDIFRNPAVPSTRVVEGVCHVYHLPALTEAMNKGVWVWYSKGLGDVAYSTEYGRTSENMRTVVGDPSRCDQEKLSDELHAPFTSVQAVRGAIAPIAAGELSLVVTTAEDRTDAADGLTSLREAIASAHSQLLDPGADGRYTITFADSIFDANGRATVSLDVIGGLQTGISLAANVVIQGRTDGREVRLAITNALDCAAFSVPSGGGLALRNLTVGYVCTAPVVGQAAKNRLADVSGGSLELTDCFFENCRPRANSSAVQVTAGVATAERCSFLGGGAVPSGYVDGLVLRTAERGDLRVIDCTFAHARLADSAVIEHAGAARLFVVSSTFLDNRVGVAGVLSDGAGPVVVANCVFCEHRIPSGDSRDIAVMGGGGTNATVCASTFSRAVRHNADGSWTELPANCLVRCQRASVAGEILLEGTNGLRRVVRNGVPRLFVPPVYNGPADRNGAYVWTDADWTNVAVTKLYVSRVDKTSLLGGDRNAATILVGRYDVACRDALDGIDVKLGTAKDRAATMGSYTTPTDAEWGEPGEVVVTDLGDDVKTEGAHDLYDGHMTLREAVDYANTHPNWRDTNGNCRVSFSRQLFLDGNDLTIVSGMRQMEITGFTNGTLTVAGPGAGDMRVTLDCKGKYRLFFVGAGNSLVLENLNVANALAQKVAGCSTYAGGAVNNCGALRVRNCSFDGCRTYGANVIPTSTLSRGRAFGGAICTEAGGVTEVSQCTFSACAALDGGAVFTAAGGSTVVATSVFSGNAALGGGVSGVGRGGAVCAEGGAGRTVLVNCTLTGNAADRHGGGAYAGATELYLLDTIVLGNFNGSDFDDTYQDEGGRTTSGHCWIGRRNEALDDRQADLGAVLSDKAPADIFGLCTTDGAGIPTNVVSRGTRHLAYPLNRAVNTRAAHVWTFDGWANVGFSENPADMSGMTVLYSDGGFAERRLRLAGTPLTEHQLGTREDRSRALMGATELYVGQEPPQPVVVTDPLAVTNGNFETFLKAYDYAATHTGVESLVSNGCITITFAGPFEIDVTSNVTLTAFTSVKLRLAGPVTFRGNGEFRPFTLDDGNGLVLDDVTFVNCLGSDGFGGAVQLAGEAAELTARRVTFDGCEARDSEGWGCGGAVSIYATSSAARFEDCTFRNGRAEVGTAVDRYECNNVSFVGCTFEGAADDRLLAEVSFPPNAMVIRADPPDRKDWYCTVDEASSRLRPGDTLKVLNPELRRDELEGVVADVNGQLEKSEPWYSVTVRETADGSFALEIGLNELAAPEIGADAEVDFEAADGTEVSVRPTNVKPGVLYGLGWSATPSGPFAVRDGGWVQADGNGVLPRALSAPKIGAAGYYRVIAR